MEALDDAVELEEELVGMAVGSAAERAAVSLRTTSILASAASKAGSTSSLRRCTALIGMAVGSRPGSGRVATRRRLAAATKCRAITV